jgi:DNA polymerase III alpha subunit
MILPVITTHYSLLKGFIKPDEAAKKCKELGYTHCLIADIETISGVVDFFNAMNQRRLAILYRRSTSSHASLLC